MEKFGKSQSIKRTEDVRFLTGGGHYVDDIAPEGALAAYVLRSPVAHGEIKGIDTSEAASAPGVRLILTAKDLEEAGVRNQIDGHRVTNIDGTKAAGPIRPVLADKRVRYVGEPVALVVADTLAEAKDAAELVELDIEDLPVHIGFGEGPEIHPEAPGNIAYDYGFGDREGTEAALKSAAHVVTTLVEDNRVIAASLEPRGAYAEMVDGRIHVAVNGQGVWEPKNQLAKALGIDASQIRVTNPDTGGGFGMKAGAYGEIVLLAAATRQLNKPVHWMSDRSEAMLTDHQGRGLVSTTTLGFDADHRIVAYKVETLSDLGAYNAGFGQGIQSVLFTKVMPGVYDQQTMWMNTKGVYTNTVQMDAYRGAGRPEAIFALERSMDNAARQLGVDPWELRRRNFIPVDAFPYTSASGMPYDVGDFHMVLDKAEQIADRAGFEARRKDAASRGRLLGQGLCYYIESILGDKEETAKVVFEEDGTVSLHVGTQSNGQGHETVYATFLSDQTGIPLDRIRVKQGDSDLIPKGGGTGGSRSVTVQNTATLATTETMIEVFSAYLAEEEGVDASEISFDDETFRIPGSNQTPTMMDVADRARAAGRTDLLTHTKTTTLDNMSFPNGAHVAEVEIDPETGGLDVTRYTVVDDLGNLINPMLAEGQVHGGVAQGIGQAVTEQVAHDPETGQLLSASFMDYGMPRADNIPFVSFTSAPVPSKYNPMGMKGCGEAGTVGALAAIANAVRDALDGRIERDVQMPFTPQRIWQALDEADRGAA